jgi:hypothetical protein
MDSKYKEHLVCFDAKIQFLTTEYPLTNEAIETYLIKEDIGEIVSVNSSSLFSHGGSYAQENAKNISFDKILKNIPDEFDDYAGYLWIELDKLNEFIKNNKKYIKQEIYTIAITSIENRSNEDQEIDKKYRKSYAENHERMSDFPPHWETRPEKISTDWTFLGYDIIDGAFGGELSGLTNCGYNKVDKKTIESNKWENDLNSYHLFNSIDIANEFRKFTNNRVNEHAPFYIFGIYLIERMS